MKNKAIAALALLALVGCADGMHGAHDLIPVNRAASNPADGGAVPSDIDQEPALGPKGEIPDAIPDDPRLTAKGVPDYPFAPTQGIAAHIQKIHLDTVGGKQVFTLDIDDGSGHNKPVHFNLPTLQTSGSTPIQLTSVDNPDLQLTGNFAFGSNGVLNGDLTVNQFSAPAPSATAPQTGQRSQPAPTLVSSAEIVSTEQEGTATFNPQAQDGTPDAALDHQVADIGAATVATLDTFTVIGPDESAQGQANSGNSNNTTTAPRSQRTRPAKILFQTRQRRPNTNNQTTGDSSPVITLTGETQQSINGSFAPVDVQGPAAPANAYYMSSTDHNLLIFTELNDGSRSTSGILTFKPKNAASNTPSPSDLKADAIEFPAFSNDGAFLKMDLSDPEIAQTINDLNQNIHIQGVQDLIRQLQSNPRYSAKFSRFLETANPARQYFETIFTHFRIPPAFAYISANESGFFSYTLPSRHVRKPYYVTPPYQADWNHSSSSTGPFMLNYDAANGVGDMNVVDNRSDFSLGVRTTWDERRYLIPSTCGAAKYLSYLTKLYQKGDHTLVVLGYFQGEFGGVRQAMQSQGIYSTPVNRRGNIVFQKFLDNMDKYPGITYRSLVGLRRHGSSVLPPAVVKYANTFLAYYFVGGNLTGYHFPTPNYMTERIHPEYLVPSAPMRDAECTQLWESLKSI